MAPAQVRLLPGTPGSQNLYQYRVELRDLSAGRDYLYQLTDGNRIIADNLSFRTAAPGPLTFLVLGDSGTGSDAQLALAHRIVDQENPSLVLHVGDASQEMGTLEQLDSTYLDVYSALMARAPFFPSPGNHDYYTDSGAPFYSIHNTPKSDVPAEDTGKYYSFDWGNVHFVSLNSNLADYPAAFDRMIEWVDRDLQQQRNFWKIVYFHHPPYPTGHHANDPISAAIRDRVVPVLERNGVQLVFSGHEHSYQRSFPLRGGAPVQGTGGTTYVISGGGGGVLHNINPSPLVAVGKSAHNYVRVEVRGARLVVTAIGIDGGVLDTFTITARAKPAMEAVVNLGSSNPALAGGSVISIFGRGFATDTADASGASATVNDRPVPILSLYPWQLTAQLPYHLSGPATLRVHTRESSVETKIEVRSNAPTILEAWKGYRRFASIWQSDSQTLVTPATPVRPGEYVTVYAVGLGAVRGEIDTGQPAPAAPPLPVSDNVTVRIGDVSVTPDFAGLTPGYVGLYQVNVRIPADTPPGANAFRLVANGASSDPTTLFVQQP